MNKMVDGVVIDMTQEEIDEFEAKRMAIQAPADAESGTIVTICANSAPPDGWDFCDGTKGTQNLNVGAPPSTKYIRKA